MITPTFVAIDPTVAQQNGALLAYVFPRPQHARWLVAVGPIVFGAEPSPWFETIDGDFVHVPVSRYFTAPDAAAAVAFATGIGMSAARELEGQGIAKVLIVYGTVVERTATSEGEPAFGIYLGFAAERP